MYMYILIYIYIYYIYRYLYTINIIYIYIYTHTHTQGHEAPSTHRTPMFLSFFSMVNCWASEVHGNKRSIE